MSLLLELLRRNGRSVRPHSKSLSRTSLAIKWSGRDERFICQRSLAICPRVKELDMFIELRNRVSLPHNDSPFLPPSLVPWLLFESRTSSPQSRGFVDQRDCPRAGVCQGRVIGVSCMHLATDNLVTAWDRINDRSSLAGRLG